MVGTWDMKGMLDNIKKGIFGKCIRMRPWWPSSEQYKMSMLIFWWLDSLGSSSSIYRMVGPTRSTVSIINHTLSVASMNKRGPLAFLRTICITNFPFYEACKQTMSSKIKDLSNSTLSLSHAQFTFFFAVFFFFLMFSCAQILLGH